MEKTAEKKVTTVKALKVILIIYTCILVVLIVQSIYSWVTNMPDTNYVFTASSAACYCAVIAMYEEEKKREAKRKAEKEADNEAEKKEE